MMKYIDFVLRISSQQKQLRNQYCKQNVNTNSHMYPVCEGLRSKEGLTKLPVLTSQQNMMILNN